MFGQIRRPRFKCTIQCIANSLLPLPNCGIPHLARSASAWFELTGGSLKICRTLVCALHCGGKVLEKSAELIKHDRQDSG